MPNDGPKSCEGGVVDSGLFKDAVKAGQTDLLLGGLGALFKERAGEVLSAGLKSGRSPVSAPKTSSAE